MNPVQKPRAALFTQYSEWVAYDGVMLVTIATILLVLWLLGIVTGNTLGWFIHILLVAAIIMFLIRLIQGRNPID